ncbi:hypothetical protein ACQUSY_12760 [Microbacterium sp. YY-03]|uniref:hypothetical protein n=1 Tax=Microbacterium sp. YY-03 TaxID=3421636 RepID=UPI003D16D7E5|nr:hypothetical protein [Micrococcus luteus]
MSAYLVTYDLNAPGQDYESLIERIKFYGTWANLMKSTWIVVSNKSADAVYTHLRGAMDDSGWLFVVDISGQDRQGWLTKDTWEWIRKHV